MTAVPLPLPGSDAGTVSAYFREQTAAVVANSVAQGVSALGLGVYVGAVARRLSSPGPSARGRLCRVVGAVAVVSLALSALTTLTLAVVASRVGAGTVAALQQVGFVLGGVVHVVSLGVLVWCLGRAGTWSTSVQRFGWVAAVPAVLSLLSVVVFPASVLLPLGRVLCMVWVIAAGVSLWRGRSLSAGPA